jgi:hypothetical protein
VTAVGGTSLRRSSTSRGWTETAWSGAGSGCSRYVAKPSWQHDTGCARRTVADVSAVADPNTGVAVYDTYGSGGWLVFGGTSAAAPIVAGAYALLSDTGTLGGGYFAAHPDRVFDVTSGANGSCTFTYLCTAVPGYDGPTGQGSPNLGGAVLPAPQAPGARTGAVTAITSTAATVNGTVNPSGSATTYHVDYGATTSYGTSTSPVPAGSGTSDQAVAVTLAALQPAATYHARLVASNAAGTTYGDDVLFTTAAASGPATHDVAPSVLTVSTGTSVGGGLTSLAALDGATFDLASTRTTTPVTNWNATFPGIARASTSLQVTFAASATQPCTQQLSIYDATSRVWTVLDTRSEGTAPATTALAVTGTLSRYVSGTKATGNVRVRVKCTGGRNAPFTQRSDLLRVTWGA